MPIPDRSELPPKFVEWLERQEAERAAAGPPAKPLLPAESTPQELVDAAVLLDERIAHHRKDGSQAAELIELEVRDLKKFTSGNNHY